jgi:gluconokinase
MVTVLMGVSGSGKTTIGKLLAEKLGTEFAEGDAYHPPANVEKMRRGIPLDDADRWPWLEILSREIDCWLAAGTDVVLACSALRQSYRDVLANGRPEVRFVFLKGDQQLIRARLDRRQGHYMPPSLLASQIATLEEPEGAITVDVAGTPEAIVAEIRRGLRAGQPASRKARSRAATTVASRIAERSPGKTSRR